MLNVYWRCKTDFRAPPTTRSIRPKQPPPFGHQLLIHIYKLDEKLLQKQKDILISFNPHSRKDLLMKTTRIINC